MSKTTIRSVALIVLGLSIVSAAFAQETKEGLDRWGFLIGEWDVVESRYDFDGELIQTNEGKSAFSHTLRGQRIQEIQSIARGNDTIDVLHVFVYDPRSEEVEIARTDSGHFGFWVIIGSMTSEEMVLRAKHPDPDSDITRRISYRKVSDDQFRRQLEFSTDGGESWFVRSSTEYERS